MPLSISHVRNFSANLIVLKHTSVFHHCTENDEEAIQTHGRDHEIILIEHRFMDMNRQIGVLMSMVKALTEKMSISTEEKGQSVRNDETSLRSDMVTGVSANPIPTSNIQQPRRTSQSFHKAQMDDVMTEIQIIPSSMTVGVYYHLKNSFTNSFIQRKSCNEFRGSITNLNITEESP